VPLELDRLRQELVRLGPTRRLAMLSAEPVLRGDLLQLIALIGCFARRCSPSDRQTMALALLQQASELDVRLN